MIPQNKRNVGSGGKSSSFPSHRTGCGSTFVALYGRGGSSFWGPQAYTIFGAFCKKKKAKLKMQN